MYVYYVCAESYIYVSRLKIVRILTLSSYKMSIFAIANKSIEDTRCIKQLPHFIFILYYTLYIKKYFFY